MEGTGTGTGTGGAASSYFTRSKSNHQTYQLISSDDFMFAMERGASRVHSFVSSKGKREFRDLVRLLKDGFKDFFAYECPTKQECTRLFTLTQQILLNWVNMEQKIVELGVKPSRPEWSELPIVIPSAWLLEENWHALAYEEVCSIRTAHINFLEKAYKATYTAYSKKNLDGHGVMRNKECLNFLAISKHELNLLSKKKCYKRVMKCKHLLASKRQPMYPLSQPGSSTSQTQMLNWRDGMYNQIRSLREEYSYQLDKALMTLEGLGDESKDCRAFLSDSLQFLARSRADIVVLVSEDDCTHWLGKITSFFTNTDESLETTQHRKLIESTGQWSYQNKPAKNKVANWRDLAYEKLQKKADRFKYNLYNLYNLRDSQEWDMTISVLGKMKKFDAKLQREDIKKLEGHLKKACDIYDMPRSEMTRFKSMDDFRDSLQQNLREELRRSIELMNSLRRNLEKKGPLRACDENRMIPKLKK